MKYISILTFVIVSCLLVAACGPNIDPIERALGNIRIREIDGVDDFNENVAVLNDSIDRVVTLAEQNDLPVTQVGLDENTIRLIEDINSTIGDINEFGLNGASLARMDQLNNNIAQINQTIQSGINANVNTTVGLDPETQAALNHAVNEIHAALQEIQVTVGVDEETRQVLDELRLTWENTPGQFEEAIEQALDKLSQINSQAAEDYHNRLSALLTQARQESQIVINYGLQATLCATDQIEGKVSQLAGKIIQENIDKIFRRHDPLPEVKAPWVCYISPAQVELFEQNGKRYSNDYQFTITGFNFFGTLPDAIVVDSQGAQVSSIQLRPPSRRSEYEIYLNMQDVDLSRAQPGDKIVFEWAGVQYDVSIPIFLPGPTATPTLTLTPTPLPTNIPTHTPTPTSTPFPELSVSEENVPVLSGPSNEYTTLGQLQLGNKYLCTGKTFDESWLRINYNGQNGWIFFDRSYVTTTNLDGCQIIVDYPPPPLPTVTPIPPSPPPPPLPTATPIPPPVANFQCGPLEGIAPLKINCVDLSTNNPTQWLWEFGDGSISNSLNPSHTYNSAGQFIIRLTVTNNQGSSTKEGIVNVQSPPPPPPPPPPPSPPEYALDPNSHIVIPGGGGNGGSPFTLNCPTNHVVAGFLGRSGSRLDQIQLLCRSLNTDGSLGNSVLTAATGGSGGTGFSISCTGNKMLVSAFGRTGSRVDNLGANCSNVLGTSNSSIGPVGGSGGTAFLSNCPNNHVITGISGRSGAEIDHINFRCTKIVTN